MTKKSVTTYDLHERGKDIVKHKKGKEKCEREWKH